MAGLAHDRVITFRNPNPTPTMLDLDSRLPWPFPSARRSPPAAALDLQTPTPDHIELVGWYDATKATRPDSEITVQLQLRDAEGGTSVETGWWDGEVWRLAESGGVPMHRVTFWAAVDGPDA